MFEFISDPGLQLVHCPVDESQVEQLELQEMHEVPFYEKVRFEQTEQKSPTG